MPFQSFRKFLADEDGGYTMWFLTWFAMFVMFSGLAVDIGDAFRVETELQATADAAALAGAMSLPDDNAVVNQALLVAEGNMPKVMGTQPLHGNVTKPSEIVTGYWDIPSKTFVPGGTPKNAVYVVTRRGDANENPLSPMFLRILAAWDFRNFDLATVAIAAQYVPQCLLYNGLVAGNKIDFQSGNTFAGLCLHAQNELFDKGKDYAVKVGNGNVVVNSPINGMQTEISYPASYDPMTGQDADGRGLDERPNVCTQNDGVCEAVAPETDLPPLDVLGLDGIFAGYRAYDPANSATWGPIPSYMFQNGGLTPPARQVISEDYASNGGTFDEYTVYIANCSNKNKNLKLGANVDLKHVVIVATCMISSSSNGKIRASVLASSSVGNGKSGIDQNSISFANGWDFGTINWCPPPKGDGSAADEDVRLYSKASIQIVAQTYIYGLHAVAAGDFNMTANGVVGGI
ncbi:MAG TPA: pilus assembly protein TadG-related protein, partial [Thermohalobaculum sp.]|nr:pilus assembly protein TadG-related protein [Thermohalobaculum sp.]